MNIDHLKKAYDTKIFRKTAHNIVDIISDHLENAMSSNSKVHSLRYNNPTDIMKLWDNNFNKQDITAVDIVNKMLERSIHLHHPKNMGHQVAVSLPIAAVADFVSAILNPTIAAFEGSESQFAIETFIVNWMCEKLGFKHNFGGFFVSGGSLGNLSALLAAREIMSESNIWNKGVKEYSNFAVLVSENAHYCVSRSLQIMGLGKDSIIIIPTTDTFHVTKEALNQKFKEANKKKKHVFAVIGSACNTGPGTFEDLNTMADFCEENNIWFHVDGAHGASLCLSKQFKYLIHGIERANSVVWDAHKMMMMPALCTGVLFKKYEDSFKVIQHKAPYLYESKSKDETKDWYNISKRTIECTKNSMCFKLYMCLKLYGEQLFEEYVNQTLLNTRLFARIVKTSENLELALEPESNIVCFRYITKNMTKKKANSIQTQIRDSVVKTGNYYIVKTMLHGKIYLRVTLMNPFSTEDDFRDLIEIIKKIGKKITSI